VSAKKEVSEVLLKPDGELLYVVYDGTSSNLWTQDMGGGVARQLTFGSDINYRPALTPNQRYIVFASSRAGNTNIWRMDADGTQLKQLTSGTYEDMPSVTPDGEWIIYFAGGSVRKVSINGGSSSVLFDKAGLNPVTSPDGRMLAFFAKDRTDIQIWRLQLLDLQTLSTVKQFELPEATNYSYSLRWTPDGNGLTFISKADGASNIWLQPISGRAPRRLTDFKDAEIQSFSWSADGKRIVCVRRAKTYIPMLVRPF
jgi:Tol biopolymer transport system component